MLAELFLLLALSVVSLLMYLQHRTFSAQISELTKAVIAKNSQEFADLKRVDKIKPEKPYQEEEIPLGELDDKKWLETISK